MSQLSSLAMLSPGAIAEIEYDFDEVEQQLRAAAAGQLSACGSPGSSSGARALSPTS